ncbi:MAG: acetylxylan esterase [Chthoniobacteraceae bacterium]|nr:acetylxylan esterase [Chthoniobacteraceae bacterium]
MSAFAHDFPFDPTYGYDLDALLQLQAPEGPSDLADFWRATYREARAVPLNLSVRPLPSPHPGTDLFEVHYDSLGGRRIGAWITVPHGQRLQRGMVVGHGYGGRECPDFDLPGPECVAIFPCARGFHLSQGDGLPNDAARHVITGIASRETYIHRGCVADYWGAASALLSLYPEAAGSLHYMGTSFGGGIGAMTLAWDERFVSGYLCVPSFGNHPLRVQCPCAGSGEAVRQYVQQHPETLEVLRYFDSASIARHIRIPVLCDCALFDPAVPPPGQFSVHNALGRPKELMVRQAGHFAHPGEAAEEARSRARLDRWLHEH